MYPIYVHVLHLIMHLEPSKMYLYISYPIWLCKIDTKTINNLIYIRPDHIPLYCCLYNSGIRAILNTMAMPTNTLFFYSPSQVPIFDGEQYDYWRSQMQTFFISQDIWEVVEDGYEEQDQASLTDQQLKLYKGTVKNDATALRYIQQGVSKTIFPRIFGITRAKQAWDTLKDEFQGSEKVISIKLQS